MHFGFTEEERLFADTFRELLQRECTPAVVRRAWENETGRGEGLWQSMVELGIVGMSAPEEAGGLGMDAVPLVLLLEEAGRAALPEPLVETTGVALPLLAACSSEGIKDRWMSAMVAGDATAAVGMGPSPLVAGAHAAEVLILEREGALYAVPTTEVRLSGQSSVDRSRRLSSVEWTPSESTLLARGEEAARLRAEAFNRGALGNAAMQVGLARAMIDLTVEYTLVREQFGKPIGSFQAIKHMLANALLKVEFARPVIYRAAHSVATQHAAVDLHSSMAAIYGADAATSTAKICLQAHGAIGYSFEHDLHLWMKRSWSLKNAWGDTAWHRNRAADAVLH